MCVQRCRVAIAAIAVLVAGAISLPGVARADDPASEARAAYDRAVAAHAQGDETTAEHEFAKADALVPSDAAFEAALASALRADDAMFGMALVDRASTRGLDASAAATVARARAAFAPRVLSIVVACGTAAHCSAAIDDSLQAPLPRNATSIALYGTPGAHEITVIRDDRRNVVAISGAAGERVYVQAADEPRPNPPLSNRRDQPAESSSSLATPIAYGAIGLTLVLGGFSIASGIDARNKRSDFEREQCGADSVSSAPPGADCSHFSDAGHNAQLRTNWLLAGTALAGVGTLAFILVAKPFGSRSRVSVSASTSGIRAAFAFSSL